MAAKLDNPWGPPPPDALRVLVVDDRPDMTTSMAMVLSAWGHDVRTASDGKEALQAAEEFRPQVILMDHGLPHLSGLAVAEKLRAQPQHQGTFLIALTGYGGEEHRRRSLEAGFDLHLVKPVELHELEGLLARHKNALV